MTVAVRAREMSELASGHGALLSHLQAVAFSLTH